MLLFADAHTNLISNYSAQLPLTRWGYSEKFSQVILVCVTAFAGLSLAALVLLWQYRRRSKDAIVRAQTVLFIHAVAIPLLIGSITNGILPIIHITSVPPLTVTSFAITGILLSIGIVKYRFLNFAPSLIADNVLDTMSDAVIGIQSDLSLNYINNGAAQMLGYNTSVSSQRHLNEFLAHPCTVGQMQQMIIDPLKDKNLVTIESIDFKDTQGRIITTKLTVSNVSDNDQPFGFVVVLTDITVLTNLKSTVEKQVTEWTIQFNHEHARLEAAINSMDVGVMITFKDRTTASCNTALRSMLGLNPVQKEEEGQSFISLDDVIGKLPSSPNFDLTAAIKKCHEVGTSFKYGDVMYSNRFLSIEGNPVINLAHQIIGSVVLIEDITERKITERSKDEFFSIASHELRTPLTAIRGNSDMVKQYFANKVNDRNFDEMIQDIHSSSVRLIEIVNDFLDTTRLEQGKMQFKLENFDISKVIESIVYEMSGVVTHKGLHLQFNKTLDAQTVYADKDKTKQIIYNLIGNALKFTNQGGIMLSTEPDENYLRVLITDTGIGIPPDKQSLLFRRFQQAESNILTRDATKGTGLGLYISKLLAENIGGKLVLDSTEPNKGTTFSFTLPNRPPIA